MNISSIIPYNDIPESLDKYIEKFGFSELNVYIDLKNSSIGLFVKDIVEEIVNKTEETGVTNSYIFQSLLLNCASWVRYAKYKNIKYNIYICNDVGRSRYHKNILNDYKKCREIANTSLGAELQEKITRIRHKNFELADKVLNKIQNIYFFSLSFLESDFLPHYLISRVNTNPKALHVICSNDKDHYQTLNLPNTIMFSKRGMDYNFYTKKDILKRYVKFEKMSEENKMKKIDILKKINPRYISLMMAMCGDKSDDVPGLQGIGQVGSAMFFENAGYVNSLFGEYEELVNRVLNENNILKEGNDYGIIEDKFVKKIVTDRDKLLTSFKLIDYEILIRFYEKEDSTVKIDIMNYIRNVLNKKDCIISDSNTLKKHINKLKDFSLDFDSLEHLF